MPFALSCAGLACGMLLTAVGLVLWDSVHRVTGLRRAVQAIGWLAGATLVVGLLLTWRGSPSPPAAVLRLILMAAVAAPPGSWRRGSSPWGNLTLVLPALILAGTGLLWTSGLVDAEAEGALFTPVRWALAVGGGLGVRALAEVASAIAASASRLGRSVVVAYALLTLLLGGVALVSLWLRGTVAGGAAGTEELAGAWLVWSVAWLDLRRVPRWRMALTTVAALLLISAALGFV